MTVMDLELRDPTQQQSNAAFDVFMPDLGDRYGYYLGVLSGRMNVKEVEPFVYGGQAKAKLVACPLFDEMRVGICLQASMHKNAVGGRVYSKRYYDTAVAMGNRMAIVLPPDDDDVFTVLLVTRLIQGKTDVVDFTYEYQKAMQDIGGRFMTVTMHLTKFLTEGASSHM